MDTKKQLVLKGLEHFSEKGYGGTSLIEIASAVGIKKSTIYSHFTSKDELFFEVLDSVNQEFLSFCPNCLSNDQGKSIEERLYILLVESINVNKENIRMHFYGKG